MSPARPPAELAKSVHAAWAALVDEIVSAHGKPRIHVGPAWKSAPMGVCVRVGAVWFLPLPGKDAPVNHNLSIDQYVSTSTTRATRWTIRAGRQGGIVTSAEYEVRGVFPVELLQLAARSVGLRPPLRNEAAEDLDTVREIAARANHNGEPLDPGVVLDIVGWPTGVDSGREVLNRFPAP